MQQKQLLVCILVSSIASVGFLTWAQSARGKAETTVGAELKVRWG